ncbi:sugar ABC transporter permease [Ponticoccus sp. SC2-23]|uniref:carbohydrate ABC transporter permease n=1 Tax=Alexandriicola marinus TaxID=2081710 RepID=UPI000FD6C475|nr:sugar ABC transporter permease [Alexandriicola marinus]MBM1221485.1 sugar ABC transporter permease [Ponticoccus sp. SC6-9]MBM1226526.1 sugar ABC transporter permease [Ponticoccus sp. SC6-15]MBM1230477.1 sugar ABC transporter permease [Ponticoccus sp. SC6-38]MBM1235000.1 sugar ABC transporter permease [Ponticoccus sp. SC6-45]MBM1239498.1 sugar ABC transporter permease [Ponticoccus sp. SC6-49]MBM1243280.1 sugar ABC transporter permease [Ponticoccus sp. SC2-64]MBM1248524.1 sugar ABC transpor
MASSLKNPDRTGWAFALPGTVLILTFIVIPFFFAFALSMTNQRLISPNPTEYVGLKNYRDLLGLAVVTLEPERDDSGAVVIDDDGEIVYPRLRTITRSDDYPQYRGMREWFRWQSGEDARIVIASDVVFMKALVNTLLFVLVVAPVQGGLALVLALLINQRLRGINIFRTIYFMPVVVSIVVVSLLWRFIYDGSDGLLNNVLSWITFGAFQPVDWLGNTETALGAIMAMSIWQAVGFHMVIWLSGLQTISPTLYEAAAIEGASKWQTFRYVTWPGLRHTAVLVLIVITMQAFALFAQIDVMTSGGPLDSTQTVVFQAVERGYGKQDISGGSTISVILFVIVLTISLIQRYLTREK